LIDFKEIKMNIIEEILKLKKERNAVIMAHNYTLGEIQDIADYCGDSLELARIAADCKAEVIVLCGVRFMAETAKILSPDATVLHPAVDSGCPMADMADPEDVKKIASQFVVANRAGLCNAQDDRYMYIYNGDKLVRSLRWRCCEEIVDIYEEDAAHWLLPPECHTGQVELSREFLAYLDDLLSSD
jgi:quinolinate synthetase A subunit